MLRLFSAFLYLPGRAVSQSRGATVLNYGDLLAGCDYEEFTGKGLGPSCSPSANADWWEIPKVAGTVCASGGLVLPSSHA